MWTSLSLQTRLSLQFCAMLMAAFAIVLVGLFAFSTSHFQQEREPVELLAAQIAGAINAELRADPARQDAIMRLIRRLNDHPAGSLRFRDANTPETPPSRPAFQTPAWFTGLIAGEAPPIVFPVASSSAQLVLYPSNSADIYEKWIAFVFIGVVPALFGVAIFAISQASVRATLRPLWDLGAAISKLKDGDYSVAVARTGPPEVQRASDEINALAGVLGSLRASNNAFMKRIVRAQDDERAEIGRDLHDEFGPLLFAARANALALQKQNGDRQHSALASEISSIVEAIQKTNSRLLARLRPLDLENLGLTRNIAALIDSPAAKAGDLLAEVKLDLAIDRLDELSSRTVYRFVQEAITNVLRHAKASKAGILATINSSHVTAEVSDNGIGMPDGIRLGRGLDGMKERISALGGTFAIDSNSSGTVVRCTLPLG
jgi:two-component system sensor histidine kinase UhpB